MAKRKSTSTNSQEPIVAEQTQEEVQAELDAIAAAEAAAAAEPAPLTMIKVMAVNTGYVNHYNGQKFPQGEEVEAVLEGWLQAQLDAGYIAKI